MLQQTLMWNIKIQIYWKEKETHTDFDFGNFNNYQQNEYSLNFKHTRNINWRRNGWQPLQGKFIGTMFTQSSLRMQVNDKPFYNLRAIRLTRLRWPIYVSFLDLSMHYYGLRNEQQSLKPLGNGSWDEVKGFLGLGAEFLPLDGHF
jgi:hypothetical protein